MTSSILRIEEVGIFCVWLMLTVVGTWQYTFIVATHYIGLELELPGFIAQYDYKYMPFADAPYTKVLNAFGNPATLSKWPRAPYFKLPPSDIELLESDPELRQRWTDYVVHSFLPPLRKLVEITATQVHAQYTRHAIVSCFVSSAPMILLVLTISHVLLRSFICSITAQRSWRRSPKPCRTSASTGPRCWEVRVPS
jgi:hypothetical protein